MADDAYTSDVGSETNDLSPQELRKQKVRDRVRAWKIANPERAKENARRYREQNKEKLTSRAAVQRERDREKIRERQKAWRAKNKDKNTDKLKRWETEQAKLYQKAYREKNRERLTNYRSKYREEKKEAIRARKRTELAKAKARLSYKRRYENDPAFRLRRVLSEALRQSIKKASSVKAGGIVRLIGCSLEELQVHIERQFTKGMNWQNHGKGKGRWHVDHIRPCASFDLRDEAEQKRCFHFTNLRPLWGTENQQKSGRLTVLL